MTVVMKLRGVCACLGLALAAAPVSAIPYYLNFSIGTGSVAGSVTTDGTLGILTTANITAFSLSLNDSANTLLINNGNAQAAIVGTALTATAGGLFFNFSAVGSQYALFQSPFIGSGNKFACIQSNGCFDFSGGGAAVDVTSQFPGQVVRISGLQQVAIAAPPPPPPPPPASVPEPASWALMLVGFGAIGQAMRRTRRIVVRYR